MRYERKYRVKGVSLQEWEQLILQVPVFFRTAFPVRTIHNIYFDTIDFHYLNQNIDGVQHRSKFRLRWYNDKLHKAKLEQKGKHGFLGFKNMFDMPEPELQDLSALQQRVHQMQVTEEAIYPVYYNRYKRKYFVSTDKKFRVTLDYEQTFESLTGKNRIPERPLYHDDALIIELKYEEEYDREALLIIEHIPTRNTKNSKYVNGMWISK